MLKALHLCIAAPHVALVFHECVSLKGFMNPQGQSQPKGNQINLLKHG